MSFARKLVLGTVATVLSLSVVGATGAVAPASAQDSSWGCGGWCKPVPRP